MEPFEQDVLDLARRLDALVEGARPVPFVNSQIMLDREPVYDVLDGLRATVAFAYKQVVWFRQKRADAGDPPLGEGGAGSEELYAEVDAIDDLIHNAPSVPLSDRVRVGRDQIEPRVKRLCGELTRLGKELADFKSIYPDSVNQ